MYVASNMVQIMWRKSFGEFPIFAMNTNRLPHFVMQ